MDELRLAQNAEVVADGWLVKIELGSDVADTHRLRLVRQQVEHTQPRWVCQRLQPICQRHRLSSIQAQRHSFLAAARCARLTVRLR